MTLKKQQLFDMSYGNNYIYSSAGAMAGTAILCLNQERNTRSLQ